MARAKRAKSKGKKPRYSRKRKYTKRKYSKKRGVTRTRRVYRKKRPVMRRRKSYRKSSGPSIGEMSWVVNNFGMGGMASAPSSMPRKYQRQMPSSSFGGSIFPLLSESEEYKIGTEI